MQRVDATKAQFLPLKICANILNVHNNRNTLVMSWSPFSSFLTSTFEKNFKILVFICFIYFFLWVILSWLDIWKASTKDFSTLEIPSWETVYYQGDLDSTYHGGQISLFIRVCTSCWKSSLLTGLQYSFIFFFMVKSLSPSLRAPNGE